MPTVKTTTCEYNIAGYCNLAKMLSPEDDFPCENYPNCLHRSIAKTNQKLDALLGECLNMVREIKNEK